MDPTRVDDMTAMTKEPHEVWKLIRKLRWIGLEDEARRLQLAMRAVSPEDSGLPPIETFGTD